MSNVEDLHCAVCGHTIEIKVADIEEVPKRYIGECKRCEATTIVIMEQGPEQKVATHICEVCGSSNVEVLRAGDTIFRIICKECFKDE